MNDTKELLVPAEIIPPPLGHEERIDEVDDFKGYAGVATLVIAPEKAAKLREVLPDDGHDILPTGEVYVSQVHYRRVLNDTFGPGQWALVPRGGFTVSDNTMMREYALVIGGRFISEAVGESDYQPGNARMSYATTAEAVKSNALMRCCKDLGIASECWDRQWTEAWKDQFAIQVWREGSKKPQWRRKDAKMFFDETGGVVEQGRRAQSVASSAEPPRKPQEPTKRTPGLDGEILDLAEGLCAMPGVGLTVSEAISRASAFFGREHKRKDEEMSSEERWESQVPLENGVMAFRDPARQKSEKWKKGTAAKLRDRITVLESGEMGDAFVEETE